jgi:hypothetical protein
LVFSPCGRWPLRHVIRKPTSPGLPKMEQGHVVPARQPDKGLRECYRASPAAREASFGFGDAPLPSRTSSPLSPFHLDSPRPFVGPEICGAGMYSAREGF